MNGRRNRGNCWFRSRNQANWLEPSTKACGWLRLGQFDSGARIATVMLSRQPPIGCMHTRSRVDDCLTTIQDLSHFTRIEMPSRDF